MSAGRRLRASVSLSALFLVVYGACNLFTTQRSDVGLWFFEWERQIPFVPQLILPYLSIDLFFVVAPFLCSGLPQLVALEKRVATAVLVAAGFFLVLPLRFAFERHVAPGFWGRVFDQFRLLDAPHNLFPSLHVALLAILADVWLRWASRPGVRAGLATWFLLILVSTVLTYQHHVIDVAGGGLLAAVCLHLYPGTRLAGHPNLFLSSLYGAGAACLLVAGVLTRPWGALLAWPAFALASAAVAYRRGDAGLYRKSDGRVPLATKVALLPLVLGQRLSLLHYRRRCAPYDEVAPGVLLGRTLGDEEAADAIRSHSVTAVLDLTCEMDEAAPFRALSRAAPFRAVRYHHLPVLDLTAPTSDQLAEGAAFLARESAGGVVYVHCKVGWSRSAAAAGAFLLASRRAASAEEAIALLRKGRPSLFVRPEAVEALRSFAGRTLPDTPAEAGRAGGGGRTS